MDGNEPINQAFVELKPGCSELPSQVFTGPCPCERVCVCFVHNVSLY